MDYGLGVMGGVDIQEETIVGELVNVLKCFIYVNQFRHSSIKRTDMSIHY